MFYPREMTGIWLAIPAKDVLAVTRMLADQGVFHQVDASYLGSEKELDSTNSWSERAAAYAALERRVTSIMQTLGMEEGAPLITDQALTIEVDEARLIVEQMEKKVRQTMEQLVEEQEGLKQLQSALVQLEPVAGIGADMSALRNPHYLHSLLGVMPLANMDRLQTSLERVPFVFVPLREDDQKAVVWLAGMKRDADILERAARSAYVNPWSLPEIYQGAPSKIIGALHTSMGHAQRHVAELQTAVGQLHTDWKQQLQALLWRLRASGMQADAIGRFGRLHYIYIIVGWVPSSKLADLSRRLEQVSPGTLLETSSSRRGRIKENVPVDLDNPRVLRPFQQLVTNYARPRYEEVDPTFLLALTFPILFGAMFGDVGHGLALALVGGVLASRKIRALRSLAGVGELITMCGVAATLFGFVYGSIFGLENVLPSLWIRPINNITQILAVAIGAGVVLLSVGFLLNILNAWTERDWGRLLFDHHGAAGLALYWSLIGLAAGAFARLPIPSPVFVVLAVVGGLGVMLSEALKHLVEGHRPLVETGLGTFAIQTVFELFEALIGYLSNSLSYVRVGAFAVAHAGLSAVVFILAELVSPSRGAGYWIVFAIGNLFIVGFEGLVVSIQTMRLEYYELFDKFFTGGGTRYKPLTLLPQIKE